MRASKRGVKLVADTSSWSLARLRFRRRCAREELRSRREGTWVFLRRRKCEPRGDRKRRVCPLNREAAASSSPDVDRNISARDRAAGHALHGVNGCIGSERAPSWVFHLWSLRAQARAFHRLPARHAARIKPVYKGLSGKGRVRSLPILILPNLASVKTPKTTRTPLQSAFKIKVTNKNCSFSL